MGETTNEWDFEEVARRRGGGMGNLQRLLFCIVVGILLHTQEIGVCYMAPIQFPLILYLIIDIHVFLVIIPFGWINMNSCNSAGLFLK